MRQHNLCLLMIRLIMIMYINQNMPVRWISSISKSFHISNGVKQGGVISPVSFGLYIDNRIKIIDYYYYYNYYYYSLLLLSCLTKM